MMTTRRLALACGGISTVAIAMSALTAVPEGRGMDIVRYPLLGNPEPLESIPALVATTLSAAQALYEVSSGADLAVLVGQEKISRRIGTRRDIVPIGLITAWCSAGPMFMFSGDDWIPTEDVDEFLAAVDKATAPYVRDDIDRELHKVALALRDSFLAQVPFDLNQETMRLQ